MGALLGLLGAVVYGAADFVGGLTCRRAEGLAAGGTRTSTFAVVLWSQVVGLAILVVLVAVDRTAPTPRGLAWGAVAGIGGGTGVLLLYRGLARGRMSVVAPITAAIAATIPLVVGVATGDRPGALAWVGVALALAAVVLVSSSSSPGAANVDAGSSRSGGLLQRPGIPEAMGSGLGFGLWFVALGLAGESGSTWALIAARTSIPLIAVLALLGRQPLAAPRPTWAGIAVTGLLDQGANVIYLLATRRGLLSLVAVLTSLYPASTVLLARIVLHERFTPLQLTGLAAAGTGVVLITAG